jgi:phage gp36-like protein
MGSYFAQSHVENRLQAQFQKLYRLPDQLDDLNQDIADVDAEINAYVGRRYAVPVSDGMAVAFLRPIGLDLIEERAWRRGASPEIPKKVAEAAEEARAKLKGIARGEISLGGATAPAERSTGGAEAIVVEGNVPEFTRTQMEGF